MSIVSLADVKTYLGLTGTGDDQLISSCIVSSEGKISADTGRAFSYSSNVSRTYSSNGDASVTIRDVPAAASNSLTVTLSGSTLTSGTGYWLLQDRRNPAVSTTIQLRPYNRTVPDWYKQDPQWFDKNMDNPRYWASIGSPNDLTIAGPEGHPNPIPGDVVGMHQKMAALHYWQAKSGASGTVQVPTGETIDLTADPIGYDEFVAKWKIKTAVAKI